MVQCTVAPVLKLVVCHAQVTILFSDIVNFTTMSHELPTEFIINMLEVSP